MDVRNWFFVKWLLCGLGVLASVLASLTQYDNGFTGLGYVLLFVSALCLWESGFIWFALRENVQKPKYRVGWIIAKLVTGLIGALAALLIIPFTRFFEKNWEICTGVSIGLATVIAFLWFNKVKIWDDIVKEPSPELLKEEMEETVNTELNISSVKPKATRKPRDL